MVLCFGGCLSLAKLYILSPKIAAEHLKVVGMRHIFPFVKAGEGEEIFVDSSAIFKVEEVVKVEKTWIFLLKCLYEVK